MGKYDGRRSQSAATVPVALSVAGSDSSAGAGIQADIKTFSARGVYGLTAVTCVVAEIPGKFSYRCDQGWSPLLRGNRVRRSEDDTGFGEDVCATDSAGGRSGLCSNEWRSSH